MKIKRIRKALRTIGDVRALILGLPKRFRDGQQERAGIKLRELSLE